MKEIPPTTLAPPTTGACAAETVAGTRRAPRAEAVRDALARLPHDELLSPFGRRRHNSVSARETERCIYASVLPQERIVDCRGSRFLSGPKKGQLGDGVYVVLGGVAHDRDPHRA